MDFLRIGESRLKITLSKDELDLYGMDLAALDYASTETRRAFWAILDDAKHETGFDAAAGKVCVQIYTSKSGGCEMYVTASPTKVDLAASAEDQTMALTVCGAIPKRYGEIVCSFDALSELLDACKVLFRQGYRSVSSAWRSAHRSVELFYLYLEGNQPEEIAGSFNSSAILAEFGKPHPELNLSFLREHCTVLIDAHAVEALSALAV